MPIVTGRTPGPGTAGQRSAAPEEQAPVWIDALVLGVVIALFGGLVALGRQWSRPFDSNPQIDLSLAALPRYSLLTLSRGFAAYFCSLAFTLAYGAAAAHNRRAEKILIPVLDILQGIPVLAFLPGLITGLVAIFPGSNTGLELACILAIFTGQAWNMTFSFYSSVKAIPSELIEVARLHRFGFWRRFLQLEVPASMIGLLWNSMMSMAGGWFFLTIVETVRFKNRDYRLPGVGSYMLEALHEKNAAAMVAACLAMVAIIVFLDQLFWRPLIAWSQKFKLEDTEAAERPTSWAYDLVRRSRLVAWLKETVKRPRFGSRATAPEVEAEGAIGVREATERAEKVANAIGAAIAAALAVLTAVGAWHLVLMLAQLTAADWGELLVALACTTARVLSIMAISLAWALPAGIAIGKSPRLSRVLQPVIQVVASFPIPMLFPLIGLGIVASGVPFGIGCTLLMLLGSQW
ncbi:MAG TPA: ABC transporter permease subunit, partial [Planctomycetota bacterium]|nr:ABC transporter permease subunit [Planctomycetota bacterium]